MWTILTLATLLGLYVFGWWLLTFVGIQIYQGLLMIILVSHRDDSEELLGDYAWREAAVQGIRREMRESGELSDVLYWFQAQGEQGIVAWALVEALIVLTWPLWIGSSYRASKLAAERYIKLWELRGRPRKR